MAHYVAPPRPRRDRPDLAGGQTQSSLKDSSSLEILHLEQRSPQILPQKRIKVEEGDTSYCDIGGSLMRNVTM